MIETKTHEKKEETAEKAEQPKPMTKHKLPDGLLTPVEATHRLKKEGLAPSNLNSQLVYTKLKASKTNKMPVKHYDADGAAFEEPQVSEHGVVLTRPGFDWEELAGWWANQPTRGSKPKEEGETEAKHAKPEEADADAGDEDELDELDDDEEDESLQEAE